MNGLAAMPVEDRGDVDKVNLVMRCKSEDIRISRVPFDGLVRLRLTIFRRYCYKQECSATRLR